MTVMTEAMQKAGIKIKPLTERVWLWLKDHPGKTYKEIAAALGVRVDSLPPTLTYLKRSGLITAAGDVSRGTNGGTYKIQRYSAAGDKYEPDWYAVSKAKDNAKYQRAKRLKDRAEARARTLQSLGLAGEAAEALLAKKPDTLSEAAKRNAVAAAQTQMSGEKSLFATIGSASIGEATGSASAGSPLVRHDEAAPNAASAVKLKGDDWMDKLTLREGLQLYRHIKQVIEL